MPILAHTLCYHLNQPLNKWAYSKVTSFASWPFIHKIINKWHESKDQKDRQVDNLRGMVTWKQGLKGNKKINLDTKRTHITIIDTKTNEGLKKKQRTIWGIKVWFDHGVANLGREIATSNTSTQFPSDLISWSWWIHGFEFYVNPSFLLGVELNVWAENKRWFRFFSCNKIPIHIFII